VEGHHLVLDLYFADGQPQRMRQTVADPTQRRRPDVIVTTGARPGRRRAAASAWALG
jgi:hypothetical protein